MGGFLQTFHDPVSKDFVLGVFDSEASTGMLKTCRKMTPSEPLDYLQTIGWMVVSRNTGNIYTNIKKSFS